MNDLRKEIFREWPHAPSHLFSPDAIYMITAGTYQKVLLFNTPAKLDFLMQQLFEETHRYNWQLHAWALITNHYHFIAKAPENVNTLKSMIRSFHSKTARRINEMEGSIGRKVWFQYWDTCLTYEKSYLARLNYVHYNPVWHGIVEDAENYHWCSMSWFVRNADSGFRRTVFSFKIDRLNIQDDFTLECGGSAAALKARVNSRNPKRRA